MIGMPCQESGAESLGEGAYVRESASGAPFVVVAAERCIEPWNRVLLAQKPNGCSFLAKGLEGHSTARKDLEEGCGLHGRACASYDSLNEDETLLEMIPHVERSSASRHRA